MKIRTPAMIVIIVLTALFIAHPLYAQTTWYVDDDAPGDPGPGDTSISDPLEDGTADHPFDAIQEGTYAAAPGDTVLVADGTYTGIGNREIRYQGKAITVRSENGPENCTVDCGAIETETRGGFYFYSGEGPGAVLEGMTITGSSFNAAHPELFGNGIYINNSSPTITGNVITHSHNDDGIYCGGGSGPAIIGNTIADCDESGIVIGNGNPIIRDNIIVRNGSTSRDGGGIHFTGASAAGRIEGNYIAGNESESGGGIYLYQLPNNTCTPVIDNNVITGNYAMHSGGGIYIFYANPLSLTNNLIAGNTAAASGGGVFLVSDDLSAPGVEPILLNCTLAHNTAFYDGGGLYVRAWNEETAAITLKNTILSGNEAASGENFFLRGAESTVTITLDHCLIEDVYQTVHIGQQTLIQVGPLLTDDPLFTDGPEGDYHLSQTAAGQAADSPAVDAGSDLAATICFNGLDETICLDSLSTRSDGIADAGTVDLGFHYPEATRSIFATLGCVPASGTLPINTLMTVALHNLHPSATRRIAGKINVDLAGGQGYSNWRAGFTNVGAGGSYLTSWVQNIPALGSLVGDSLFTLAAEDVTPSPWNLPPYPPAGDTDTASCTITGVAP